MRKSIKAVYTKSMPSNEVLEDFEFLGPSLICITLSALMAGLDRGKAYGSLFISTIITFAFIVFVSGFTLAALSNSIGVFQATSILSYCLSIFIPVSVINRFLFIYLNIPIALLALYFCMKAIYRIFIPKLPEEKKYIGLLPTFIMVSLFAWAMVTR